MSFEELSPREVKIDFILNKLDETPLIKSLQFLEILANQYPEDEVIEHHKILHHCRALELIKELEIDDIDGQDYFYAIDRKGAEVLIYEGGYHSYQKVRKSRIDQEDRLREVNLKLNSKIEKTFWLSIILGFAGGVLGFLSFINDYWGDKPRDNIQIFLVDSINSQKPNSSLQKIQIDTIKLDSLMPSIESPVNINVDSLSY